MEDLVDNPDGCTRFEPNPFKKEKCKQCGRPWSEHKGAISEDLLQGYIKAAQKVIQDKLQKEAEEREKAKAKKVQKKRNSAAPEDEWFNDGIAKDDKAADADSDDDDVGFQMFSAENLDRAPIEQRRQQIAADAKPLKVVNLIDFGECDLPEERPLENFGGSTASSEMSVGAGPGPSPALGPVGPAGGTLSTLGVPGPMDHHLMRATTGPLMTSTESLFSARVQQEVQAEIAHLQQRLQSLDEERRLQVDILNDEVAGRDQLIEELKRQQSEAEAALRETRAELEAQLSQASNRREEVHTSVVQEPQEAENQGMEVPPSVASLVDELRALCLRMQTSLADNANESDLPQAQLDRGTSPSKLSDLEVELRSLRDAVLFAETAAERASAERRQLAARVHELASRPAVPSAAVQEGLETPDASSASTPSAPSAPLAPPAPSAPAAESAESAESAEGLEVQRPVPAPASKPSSEAGPSAASLRDTMEAELQAHSRHASRQAAQALRDIRLNAEQSLAWIHQRLRTSGINGMSGMSGMSGMNMQVPAAAQA